MRDQLRQRWRFLRLYLSHPKIVGVVTPSSRYLASALVEAAGVTSANCVVELGAGTGAVTRVILEHLQPHARLLAFETLPEFVSTLQGTFSHPQLEIVPCSAGQLGAELDRRGIHRVPSIVCTLPFLDLEEPLSRSILQTSFERLEDEGVMALIQQTPFRLPLFRSIFPSVKVAAYVLRCLPPNLVVVCRRAPNLARHTAAS